ncbi:MAG: carbon-nitrogen hydrolase family protein [Thaumarchaeota archaeon]|nr:carbon-nitrogen hydrolase family protein [Nitrososphaerota archaeon]
MGDIYPKVKLAAVQAAPVFLNREVTTEKACHLIEEAAKNGAKIVGFSECFLAGFPHWVTRFQLSKERLERLYIRLFSNAVEIPSRATDDLCETARQNDCYVVMGLNEKNAETMGTLYNSQLFIDRKGRIQGKHRKLVPTLGERLVHTGGDGSTLTTFKTDYGRIGGLICGEHSNLLAKYTLLARGESVHVASWPAYMCNWGGDFILQQFAYEGRIFIISSSDYFSKEMKEELGKEGEAFEIGGGSSGIYGPRGRILAKAKIDREEILYADADMEEIVRAKMTQDIVGHYNRFDVFKFNVSEQTHYPIRTLSETTEESTKRTEVNGETEVPPLKSSEALQEH